MKTIFLTLEKYVDSQHRCVFTKYNIRDEGCFIRSLALSVETIPACVIRYVDYDIDKYLVYCSKFYYARR
jgi:hypothetical protein